MKDRKRFTSTMLALSAALKMYGKECTTEMQGVYWSALKDLTDDEFERAAQVLIRRETEFPPPAMFLEVARPQEDGASAAHQAMLAAWNAGRQVIPGQGSWFSGDLIRSQVGVAAYEAFHACGGSSAFALMDDEFHGPRIRREFAECYQRAVAGDPGKTLPTEPTRPALTTGAILQAAAEIEAGDSDWRTHMLAAEQAHRAERIKQLRKPEPLPATPEEQAVLDQIGAKLAAKRAALSSEEATP